MEDSTTTQEVKSEEPELQRTQQEALEEKDRSILPGRPGRLAAYIRSGFEEARNHRTKARNGKPSLEQILIESERQIEGVYDPNILSEIEKIGGSQAYDPMTMQKCLVAEAWLRDTLAPSDDKPWCIEPTPIPDLTEEEEQDIEQEALAEYTELPEEVKNDPSLDAAEYIGQKVQGKAAEIRDDLLRRKRKEAVEKARRMDTKIHDQLTEGSFSKAFSDFLQYFTQAPYAVIKGPVTRRKTRLVQTKNEDGEWVIEKQRVNVDHFYAPKPADVYFSPNCLELDTGDIFEIIRFQVSSLQDFIGTEGYSDENLKKTMKAYKRFGDVQWSQHEEERESYSNRDDDNQSEYNATVDVIDFWGKVPGSLIKEWGLKVKDLMDDRYYDVHAMLCGQYVIMCELNKDFLGRRPYSVTSFEPKANSLIGRGLPEKIKPAQRSANVARRSLINNMALASGPQVGVNLDRLAAGEEIESMRPWKIWQFENSQDGDGQPPIKFFIPPMISGELSELIRTFHEDADRDTGIPKYIQGDPNSAKYGAAGTARGLSMLMTAASKTMKKAINNIDEDIIQRIIKRMYEMNMQDPDISEDLKGDFIIRTRGALAMAVKDELKQARAEFLQMALSNETLINIIGQEGVLVLLREQVRDLKLPEGSVVPVDEELNERQTDKYEQMFGEVVNLALQRGLISEEVAMMLINPEQTLAEEENEAGQPGAQKQAYAEQRGLE